MLLSDKHAVIYGGAGAIGSAVAAAFEREGAFVYCPSHAQVDALDPAAVDAHAASLPRIDISFNLIAHDVVQGTPMVEMDVEDYVRPVDVGGRTNFITARAAARRMIEHGEGGVILFFGGAGDPPRGYHLGALQTGFHAIEAMRRQLAAELGRHGIRTVTIRTAGVPESIPDSFGERKAAIAAGTAEASLLGRAATLSDVGRVAAFVASDHARTMTGATVNVSAGALLD
jgi:NAD(P)-dependent dehydrogenase (short-subunit alcohol dehydrogenase family)